MLQSDKITKNKETSRFTKCLIFFTPMCSLPSKERRSLRRPFCVVFLTAKILKPPTTTNLDSLTSRTLKNKRYNFESVLSARKSSNGVLSGRQKKSIFMKLQNYETFEK